MGATAVEFATGAMSLALAALLGFSAHRAGLCTVKAVEEAVATRRGLMLLAFAKSVLWVAGVTLAIATFVPDARLRPESWALTLAGLGGGLLFGAGAVVNGGCAISTLSRLGGGEFGMLGTLLGFGFGVVATDAGTTFGLLSPTADAPPLATATHALAPWLLLALVAWMAWELVRLVRSRSRGPGLRALLLADVYRLSTAAALIGIANGLLYALHGPWIYTRTLRMTVGDGAGPPLLFWTLFAAVLAGMTLSAWQRGSLRLDIRPRPVWLRHFAGGLAMGAGAALVPGGNDVLLLHGIPNLSPHALPAFAAMLAGIALTLAIARLFGARPELVDCGGDICRTSMHDN